MLAAPGILAAPLVTSVPSPSYGHPDPRYSFFVDLNEMRAAMGVGAVRQDARLDLAADLHLRYMQLNATIAHTEIEGNPGYTRADPYQQALAAGAETNQWIGQATFRGELSGCFAYLANSVYHLQTLTSNQETIGLALRESICVANFGVVSGIADGGYGLAQWGGQQMPLDAIAYYPTGRGRVPGTFSPANEMPNPAPDLPLAGHPVMVRVNVAAPSDVLTVREFGLTGPTGSPVPVRLLVPSGAKPDSVSTAIEDSQLYRGVAFLLPEQPLAAGKYTATFVGARNGVPMVKSWQFSTF
ncbi:CAP domain-containing protein [Cupriavidus sp. USMAHM13]|uniref:CAP domain-containing protein n=1 Tax=Cupriavidus sp. USMAHM13 TaxID=1389192 RepID=UPI0009F57C78|nr:CAP domain-containing protein [Cupriavidus sp. USMAHM13]